MVEAVKCQHAELHHASGGYYLMCVGCGQTWVARRMGGSSDTDLDHAPSMTCMTPLAGCGRYVFQDAAATLIAGGSHGE